MIIWDGGNNDTPFFKPGRTSRKCYWCCACSTNVVSFCIRRTKIWGIDPSPLHCDGCQGITCIPQAWSLTVGKGLMRCVQDYPTQYTS